MVYNDSFYLGPSKARPLPNPPCLDSTSFPLAPVPLQTLCLSVCETLGEGWQMADRGDLSTQQGRGPVSILLLSGHLLQSSLKDEL